MVELENGPLVRLTTNFYVRSKQTGLELHGDLGSIWVEWHSFQGPIEICEFGKPYAPLPLVKEPFQGTEWGRAVLDMALAISENRPHRATGDQAAHVVEICCAAHQSLKRNRPVEITSTFTQPAPMDWAK
jgi:predicted dehydrogenase